jgi:hypothetical protein
MLSEGRGYEVVCSSANNSAHMMGAAEKRPSLRVASCTYLQLLIGRLQ